MRYLIDGYNLLHALGLVPSRGRMAPGQLAHARQRLLGLLKKTHDPATEVSVIFDSAGGGLDLQAEEQLDVRFARRQETADDVMEALIREHSAPKRLTVVSDDRRIQRAAHRRSCQVLGCAAYLSLAEARLHPHKPRPKASGAAEPGPADDSASWVKEFAFLERDPELKAFFDMDSFGEKEPEGSEDV